MFEIQKENLNGVHLFRLLNTESKASVVIIPELGAMVHEINLSLKEEVYPLLARCESANELIENPGFKGAKLFPFPNRINKGNYRVGKENLSIDINFPGQGHAIHGFVYQYSYEVIDEVANDNKAFFNCLLDYKGDVNGYPFPFRMQIDYQLNADGFHCKTMVKNTGNADMPMGDGWHPYFSFSNQLVDGLLLQLPGCSLMPVDELMIPTGNFIDFKEFAKAKPIGKTQFDIGFRLNGKNKLAQTIVSSPGEDLKLIVWQEHYPFLQIYIPPNRRSIAIEPMTCATDAFNNEIGLIRLKPESVFTGSYGVQLQ